MKLKMKLTLVAILLCNMALFAQDSYSLSGTISDEVNVPIPGVNVLVVSTTRGTSTDFDGVYQINVTSGDVLQFSFLGFVTKTVIITDQTTSSWNHLTDLHLGICILRSASIDVFNSNVHLVLILNLIIGIQYRHTNVTFWKHVLLHYSIRTILSERCWPHGHKGRLE